MALPLDFSSGHTLFYWFEIHNFDIILLNHFQDDDALSLKYKNKFFKQHSQTLNQTSK